VGRHESLAAIQTATVHTADLFGQSALLGTLDTVKYADLVTVDGDPLAGITELEDVDVVMKEGLTYKTAE